LSRPSACRATLWELDQRSKLPRRLGSVPCPPTFSHGRFVLTRPAKQFARQWRLGLWGRKCGKTTKTGAISIPPRRGIVETSRVSARRAPTRSCSLFSFKQTHHERALARQVSATVLRTDNKRTDPWVAVLKPCHPSHPTIPPTPTCTTPASLDAVTPPNISCLNKRLPPAAARVGYPCSR
jgi:hypothetical protein